MTSLANLSLNGCGQTPDENEHLPEEDKTFSFLVKRAKTKNMMMMMMLLLPVRHYYIYMWPLFVTVGLALACRPYSPSG